MRQSGNLHWSHRHPELVKRGTESHAAVLSEAQIAAMCAEYERNHPSKTWLARKYGVNRATVRRHLKAHGLI